MPKPTQAHTKLVGRRTPPSTDVRLPGAILPMLATVARELPPVDETEWVFEPKYDGIRILAFVAGGSVALVTRNGNAKSAQFPEIVEALQRLWKSRRKPFVIDGEIVALNAEGPARCQSPQARMHVGDVAAIAAHRRTTPVALYAFDLLLDGNDSLISEPWHVRRHLLHDVLSAPTPDVLRLSELLEGDPQSILDRAAADGWEGVIAKRASSRYTPGKRSRDWLKLKVEQRQEFVVGGYTEPRNSRQHIGALLLGYYEGDRLIYAGHTGGGFTRESLTDMWRRLRPLERQTSPFSAPVPRTNERPHWVHPSVVVEVKFNEWTAEGKLRQPIFVGVRDDKAAGDVVREPTPSPSAVHRTTSRKRSRS
jgi:bifunctional non-homologous end joining protein LigD